MCFPVNWSQEPATGDYDWDPFGDCVLCDGQHRLLHCYDPHWTAAVSSRRCGKKSRQLLQDVQNFCLPQRILD